MTMPFTIALSEKANVKKKKFICDLFYASVSHYKNEKAVTILITAKVPFVLFFYTVAGSITRVAQHNESREIRIDQGRYLGAFIPAGSYQVRIQAGFHSYFYFILQDTVIHRIANEHSVLQPLNQQLISQGAKHFSLPLRPIEQEICTLIRQVQQRNAKHVEDQVDNLKTFVDLAIIYSKQIAKKLPFQNPEEQVREIRQDLLTEIKTGKTFNLKSLLSHYSISPRTFLNYFKEKYGISPQEFMNQQKMKLAHDLLCKEDMKAKEVSEVLGYSEPTTFGTQFKKHFGYTPGEAKRRNND